MPSGVLGVDSTASPGSVVSSASPVALAVLSVESSVLVGAGSIMKVASNFTTGSFESACKKKTLQCLQRVTTGMAHRHDPAGSARPPST